MIKEKVKLWWSTAMVFVVDAGDNAFYYYISNNGVLCDIKAITTSIESLF
jgi:hypothetical protein